MHQHWMSIVKFCTNAKAASGFVLKFFVILSFDKLRHTMYQILDNVTSFYLQSMQKFIYAIDNMVVYLLIIDIIYNIQLCGSTEFTGFNTVYWVENLDETYLFLKTSFALPYIDVKRCNMLPFFSSTTPDSDFLLKPL